MATLLVSDTSVLLDLHRGGVLVSLFRLSFEFLLQKRHNSALLLLWEYTRSDFTDTHSP